MPTLSARAPPAIRPDVPAKDPPTEPEANGAGHEPEPDAKRVGPDVSLQVPKLRRFRLQLGERIHRRRLPAVLPAARDRDQRASPGAQAGQRGQTMNARRKQSDGQLSAAISNTVVKALARTTGRGPTKARTTLGENSVFVVLQDSLTVGEQTLTDAGQGQVVLDLRRRWQGVMEHDVSGEIEELTGRKVVGFMSDNHIDPDLAVEVFILEPLPHGTA
jgi:uncharacterized protein YbcI